MKQNPYLPALLTTAILLFVAGVIAFLISLGGDDLIGPGAVWLASVAIPLGALGLLLWLTACAVAWRPSDERA